MVYKSLQKNKLTEIDFNETVLSLLVYPTREEQALGLKISRQALHKRLVNHPEINEEVSHFAKYAKSLLAIASLKASDNLIRLLDSSNPYISLKASTEILDRVGCIYKEEEQNKKLQIEVVDYVPSELKNKYIEKDQSPSIDPSKS